MHFIKAIAGKVIHVAAGHLTHYQGDYEFYLHKTKSLSARAALTSASTGRPHLGQQAESKPAKPEPKSAAKSEKGPATERDQQRNRAAQHKQQQQVVQKLEKQVEQLEARQTAMATELENPAVWGDGQKAATLRREFEKNATQLLELTAKWEREASALEGLAATLR